MVANGWRRANLGGMKVYEGLRRNDGCEVTVKPGEQMNEWMVDYLADNFTLEPWKCAPPFSLGSGTVVLYRKKK